MNAVIVVPLFAKDVGVPAWFAVIETLSFVRFTVVPSTPPSETPSTPFALVAG